MNKAAKLLINLVIVCYAFAAMTGFFFSPENSMKKTPEEMTNTMSGNLGLPGPRELLAAQPDFTAEMSCLQYEKQFGHGYGETFKSSKKGDWYRHESKTYIDFFSPAEPPWRYTFKTKKFEPFIGDIENHLWFGLVESPALLARDTNLKFEMVGRESSELETDGTSESRELIKIKVTGETTVGGDFDKAEAFLYVAPHLRNLVVKTELTFPDAGRNCTLRNVSFDVPEDIFKQFADHRGLP